MASSTFIYFIFVSRICCGLKLSTGLNVLVHCFGFSPRFNVDVSDTRGFGQRTTLFWGRGKRRETNPRWAPNFQYPKTGKFLNSFVSKIVVYTFLNIAINNTTYIMLLFDSVSEVKRTLHSHRQFPGSEELWYMKAQQRQEKESCSWTNSPCFKVI